MEITGVCSADDVLNLQEMTMQMIDDGGSDDFGCEDKWVYVQRCVCTVLKKTPVYLVILLCLLQEAFESCWSLELLHKQMQDAGEDEDNLSLS